MPDIKTIREKIYWSYANLGRAHMALERGDSKYKTVHHIVRNKMYYGFISGKLNIKTLYDDERLKMTLPQICVYCGSSENLSLDHMVPRTLDGPDEADNLVWACRSCNSSKNKWDMLYWMNKKGDFPSILLLRRYLKIILNYCERLEILDEPLEKEEEFDLPFSVQKLPTSFPKLENLVLWVDKKPVGNP